MPMPFSNYNELKRWDQQGLDYAEIQQDLEAIKLLAWETSELRNTNSGYMKQISELEHDFRKLKKDRDGFWEAYNDLKSTLVNF